MGGGGGLTINSSAKRAVDASGGGRGDLKSSSGGGGGIYGGDDLLGDCSASVRSHILASAFLPCGGNGGEGLKSDQTSRLNHHGHQHQMHQQQHSHLPWANSGFLTDRKGPNDDLSVLW